MTSKQKSYNPEELLSTGQRTEQQLNELISMIGDILQLMEQLNMECNLAYREYQKVLHMLQDTLQQLKHSNEDMYSDVTCLQVTSPSPSNLLFDFSHLEEEPPLKGAASEESSLDPNNSKTLAVPSVPKALLSPFKAGGSPSKVPKALPDNARTTGFSLFGRRKNHPFGQGKTDAVRSRHFFKKGNHPRAAPGTPAQNSSQPQTERFSPPMVPSMDKVQFSAVAPRTLMRGEYAVISLFIYEKEFHQAVEELLQQNPGLLKENRSGILQVWQEAAVRIELDSPDLELSNNSQTQTWLGEYLRFDFALSLPEDYPKRQALFAAKVYINDLIATRLTFVVECTTPHIQVITPWRRDIRSAFMSYAKEDRPRAAAILLGMQKARPDLHVFFDVESLRSGDNWQEALPLEISRSDIFFLCWSHYAKESVWVRQEWNCALAVKGLSCIEPIPLESPDFCPPPRELDGKQFNDRLLYIINAERNHS